MYQIWLPGSILAVSLVAVSLGSTMPQTVLVHSNASAVSTIRCMLKCPSQARRWLHRCRRAMHLP